MGKLNQPLGSDMRALLFLVGLALLGHFAQCAVEQEKTWTKNLKELSPEQAEKMKVPDVPDDEKAKMGWVKTEQLGWVYKGGKFPWYFDPNKRGDNMRKTKRLAPGAMQNYAMPLKGERGKPLPCIVGKWSKPSKCTKTCGGGTQFETRKLVPPVHGGKACPRLKKRKSACNTRSCPIDCRQARWSKWTKCTKTCKGGTQRRSRRTTRIPVNGGKKCGAGNQKRKCNSNRNCRINCKVSGWQRWGRCSKKCGGGRKSRTRRILVSPRYGGRKCPTRKSVAACNTKGCPRNCMMKRWGKWSKCTKKCGGGTRVRYRGIRVTPKNGGRKCPTRKQTARCNVRKCPINCALTGWRAWSKCTKKCGGGRQTRRRSVRVSPRYGGRKCGRLSTTRICNRRNCPTNCKMSGWRAWGRCSKKCNTGYKWRSRSIIKRATNGGRKCGNTRQRTSCNTKRCPINCVVSGWRGWGRCNRSCNGGTRYRTRVVTRRNAYGGRGCPTLRTSGRCNTRRCPISCLVTGWRGWTRCNRSCGRGIRYRTRSIRRQNRYGGSRGQCNTLRQNQSCQIRTCHRHHRHHRHHPHGHRPHRHRPHGHRPHGHRPHRHWWGRRRLLEADTETQKE